MENKEELNFNMQKTYLKNFCIHRFFLFVKKSNHLNSQVRWQATNFGL